MNQIQVCAFIYILYKYIYSFSSIFSFVSSYLRKSSSYFLQIPKAIILIIYFDCIHISALSIIYIYLFKHKKTPPKRYFSIPWSVCAVPLMSVMSSMRVMFSMPAMSAAMLAMLSMLMAMAAFTSVRIPDKCPCKMMLNNLVRLPFHAGHKFDARLGKCRLCASADAAADDEIDLRRMEEVGKRTMPLPNGIRKLSALHCTVRNIVKFELLGSAKMLFNRLICIGYCNSHNIFSFILNPEDYRMFDPICAARNADALPADDCLRELVARRLVDARHRRTGHAHRGGTFLLRLPPIVDLTNRLELVQQEDNGFLRLLLCILRRKTPKIWIAADTAASLWSRHSSSFSVI